VHVPSTPSVTQPRRQLAAELRRLRGQRTLAEVAGRLGWSESKLSRIETGKLGISKVDLARLVDVYATSDQTRVRLDALRSRPRRPDWWEPYTDALTDPYEAYIAREAQATTISVYEAQIVPGLLQSTDYAHAVIRADSTLQDPESINQRVQVRMARQAVLAREPRPTFHAVIDEAVLSRPIGGVDLFRQQMLSLAGAAERANLTLQVLPFAVGAHRALAGSFTILEFADGIEPPLVYSEGLTGGVLRADPDEVRSYRESFAAVSALALSPEASVELINSVARA
jgi:transcriptional regulator with XRE-family HTH domain